MRQVCVFRDERMSNEEELRCLSSACIPVLRGILGIFCLVFQKALLGSRVCNSLSLELFLQLCKRHSFSGMALCLAQQVISNAFVDLTSIGNTSGGTLNGTNSNDSAGAILQPSGEKRIHSSTTGTLDEHDEGSGLRVEVPENNPLTPISLRIAALEALEALITVESNKLKQNLPSSMPILS